MKELIKGFMNNRVYKMECIQLELNGVTYISFLLISDIYIVQPEKLWIVCFELMMITSDYKGEVLAFDTGREFTYAAIHE